MIVFAKPDHTFDPISHALWLGPIRTVTRCRADPAAAAGAGCGQRGGVGPDVGHPGPGDYIVARNFTPIAPLFVMSIIASEGKPSPHYKYSNTSNTPQALQIVQVNDFHLPPGRDGHRGQPQRRQRHPVRVRADDHGGGGHRRPARAGRQHPRPLPQQQGAPLYRTPQPSSLPAEQGHTISFLA